MKRFPKYQGGGSIWQNILNSARSSISAKTAPQQSGLTQIKIKDPRKIRATTGKAIVPTRDLVSSTYSTENLKKIVKAAKKRNLSLNDIYTLAAMDLNETGWGRTDSEIGHVKGDVDENMSAEDIFVNAYIDKMRKADELKFTDPALRLQVYNGLGILHPSTEQDYHGFKSSAFYGVPIPKGGLNMRVNPLYGKQVIDLRDNVLKQNADYINYMNQLYNQKRMGGGIHRYQGGGQNIWQGTRDVYTTDRMLPQSSLDSMHLYQTNRIIPQGYRRNPTLLNPHIPEQRELIQELHRVRPEILKKKIKPVGYYTAERQNKPVQKPDKKTKFADSKDLVAPLYMKPKLHYIYTQPFRPSSSDYNVYGPGNSLIGFANNRGEFHPAMDDYAKGMNAPDAGMLKDEIALIKYLKSKGIYNPSIKR